MLRSVIRRQHSGRGRASAKAIREMIGIMFAIALIDVLYFK
jgi:hypothetical protein